MSTLTHDAPKTKDQPNKKQIIQMMEDFESSESVTVKEFCEMHDIGPSTFKTWNQVYENRHQKHVQPGGFVPLEVQLPKEERLDAPLLFAEVHGIRLYREVSAEYLKALLP
ncbi:hypothetical protein [Flavivirga sp. 57AJ16]|uniref:IS66 family insertion sequence element accessory protein TnpA n=1 Tax=Flavivirga sp. 57AJ16 TaxID=3025307 RepID=UPI0023663FC1|nr:hypothetical protein [Flavivirga sp. 57AJ16]MDD7888325.1 hypothetical protein [Flavivirga sp. 57AJ16]